MSNQNVCLLMRLYISMYIIPCMFVVCTILLTILVILCNRPGTLGSIYYLFSSAIHLYIIELIYKLFKKVYIQNNNNNNNI